MSYSIFTDKDQDFNVKNYVKKSVTYLAFAKLWLGSLRTEIDEKLANASFCCIQVSHV